MAEVENCDTSRPEQPLLTDQLSALLRNWLARLDTFGGLFVAETRLNIQAVVLLLALLVAAVIIALSLWFSVLVWLGVIAYSVVHSLMFSVSTVIILQGLLLWGLVLSMRHARLKLGYRNSLAALTELFGREPPAIKPLADEAAQKEDDDAGGSTSDRLRTEGQ